jgi:predicted amidohydrolase YtcJ
MVAHHRHALGRRAVEQSLARLHRHRRVHVEDRVPLRIDHEEGGRGDRIAEDQRLGVAVVDQETGMAGAVAVAWDGADAGRDLGIRAKRVMRSA